MLISLKEKENSNEEYTLVMMLICRAYPQSAGAPINLTHAAAVHAVIQKAKSAHARKGRVYSAYLHAYTGRKRNTKTRKKKKKQIAVTPEKLL